MCGIDGYIGYRIAGPILLNELKLLEYRGYDSAGCATINDGSLIIRKGVGTIDEVETKRSLSKMPGSVGIAHTRWATHGGVTERNAHPHCDCKGRIAVVHNGIIENHQEIKAELSGRHVFLSETDTEVIPHLIEEEIKNGNDLEGAVMRAVRRLKGSFAILAISVDEPDRIVAARNESPLVIGIGKGETFLSSDVLPFLEHTKRAVFIDDKEIVVATKDDVKYMDFNGNPIKKEITDIQWEWAGATKQGYPHFMLKEIKEGPASVKAAAAQDNRTVEEFAEMMMSAPAVHFSACGTSRHAALVGRYAFDRLNGRFLDVMLASEYSYFADKVKKGAVVIGVSQSGETADVLEGIKKARTAGARIFSIVNVTGSSLDRISEKTLHLNCGPEIGVASTKAYLAQLSVMYLLAFAAAGRTQEGKDKLNETANIMERTLQSCDEKTRELSEKLKGLEHIYYLARGINFATALEGALKIKEISYIHAEGMPAGELKHGTLALIEKGTVVVGINPTDNTYEETLSNLMETKARGAFIVGISDRPNEIYDMYIEIPKTDEMFYPLISIVPLQLLAYYTAVAKGRDPDKPRNLAKSVTVK